MRDDDLFFLLFGRSVLINVPFFIFNYAFILNKLNYICVVI